MAAFSSARHALRRLLAAPPRAASLGAGFRRAKEETYLRGVPHGQLLPRLMSSDAPGSNKQSPLSGFLANAMGTRDSANQDRVLEQNKEFQQFREEFGAKPQFNVHNTYNGGGMFKTAGRERSSIFGGSPPFKGSRTFNDKTQFARKTKKDYVHVLLKGNKTFVTVTDAKGNRKTGASAGCLEDRKGRSRLSRYAAEATAEHVGRSARKMGLKSVVMKVKGASFFKKKKKVILGFREGFRGERVRDQSPIMLIHDVTQLPHNGCRLPKQRRI